MIRPIARDPILLSQPSRPAGSQDRDTARDLAETFASHRADCVGMAANMIGVNVRIIIFDDGGKTILMYNPEITASSGAYEAEEGCLSLPGTRRARRYSTIRVRWQDADMRARTKTYTGFTAQIIQHEIDHLSGILI